MKITAIETIQLAEFPNLFWVHVHTDAGLVGLGEAFFGPSAAVAYIHESAAPRLLGQDPLAIDRHSRTLLDAYVGFSGSGAEMRGLSALDIALWDIFGQATGQPIHQLLGGLSRPSIRVYNTCAGYRYVRQSVGQLTENWGLPTGRAAGPPDQVPAPLASGLRSHGEPSQLARGADEAVGAVDPLRREQAQPEKPRAMARRWNGTRTGRSIRTPTTISRPSAS
jgi:L-alanine-DL-glutamate epimerase-like enolase superfamily enzyme